MQKCKLVVEKSINVYITRITATLKLIPRIRAADVPKYIHNIYKESEKPRGGEKWKKFKPNFRWAGKSLICEKKKLATSKSANYVSGIIKVRARRRIIREYRHQFY